MSGEKPKILVADIETFPMLYYAWRAYDDNAIRVVENTSLCAVSVKWLGGKQETVALPDFKGYKRGGRDDKKLTEWLWPLLDEADIVVAHNGDKFDVKKINYRFMIHKMKPPSPYQTVDTLKEVKKVSSWDSHRLNELTRQLKLGEKMRTGGADLWFDCLAGSEIAWRKMKKYNARDVKLLEEMYLELRPWFKNHPNMGVFSGISSCPKCGSTKLQSRGRARAVTRTYQRFHCQACGSWCRSSEQVAERASLVAARG